MYIAVECLEELDRNNSQTVYVFRARSARLHFERHFASIKFLAFRIIFDWAEIR